MPTDLTPAGQQAFLSRLNRAFWIGASALVAVGLTFALLSWLNHRSVALVLESQQSGRLARQAYNLSIDRQAAIRGYLLTHREISLATEFAARLPQKQKLDSLVKIAGDNPSQQDRARAVRTAVARWERAWAMPMLDPLNGRRNAELDSLAGKELFDSIRSAFQSYLAAEQRIYTLRVKSFDILQRISFGAIILEGLLLFGVMAWLRSKSLKQARLLFDQHEQLQVQSLDMQQQAAELEEQAVQLEEQTDEATSIAKALTETNEHLEKTIRELESAQSIASTAKSHGEVTESLLNVLLEKAPVGVILWNSKREVVRVNPTLAAMTGYDADHAVGKHVDELASEELAETVEAILDEVLEEGKTVMNVPLTGSNKIEPGRDRHFLGSYFPVLLAGNQRGVGGVVVETTQYRQLEDQLMQSQKMEAVGRLAGGVAHDFNNMLTAIMSYSDLILGDLPTDSPQRADMAEIVKAAEKATALTRKLLAFSRQQVLRPSTVDLNATVEGLHKMIKRLLGANIELSFNCARKLWTISVDPTEVERVIMNLVINARDAMPNGGKLIVETANVVIDEEYAQSHADTKAGEYVMLAITDTGSGMSREVREKVFEPFFTTKAIGKGTGLGLPSIYGIVKQSGGWVWVYSEIDKGTTFKIYLPRGQVREAGAPLTPHRNRPVGPETILLVEDDDEVRQVAARILRRNGYRVLEAENGADALRVSELESLPVDLIVTDIVMPEMGGSELAKRIRERQPDARILFTSGYTEDAVVRQSLLHDGEAFIEKPFTPAKLAKKARELLSDDEDGAN